MAIRWKTSIFSFLHRIDFPPNLRWCCRIDWLTNTNDIPGEFGLIFVFILLHRFQASLWSNEFDLSLHTEEIHSEQQTSAGLLSFLTGANDRIVVDELQSIWAIWQSKLAKLRVAGIGHHRHRTTIVLDNTGPELVADLCLGEFLLHSGLTDCVCYCPKRIPWFVSDVTSADIDWLLDEGIGGMSLEAESIGAWAQRWKKRFHDGSFQTHVSTFWTLPHSYCDLKNVDRELYNWLSHESDVVLFKVISRSRPYTVSAVERPF